MHKLTSTHKPSLSLVTPLSLHPVSYIISISLYCHTHSYHHLTHRLSQRHLGQLTDVGVCISLLPVLKVNHLSFKIFITTCKGKHYLSLCLPHQREGQRDKQKIESEITPSLCIPPSHPFSLLPVSLYLSSASLSITLYLCFQSHSLSLSHTALSKCQGGNSLT